MTKDDFPILSLWLSQTYAGTFSPRHKELRVIDGLIEKMQSSNTPDSFAVTVKRLFQAFEDYKRKHTGDNEWRNGSRDKTGMMQRLDRALNTWHSTQPKPSIAFLNEDQTFDLRGDIMYTLSHLRFRPEIAWEDIKNVKEIASSFHEAGVAVKDMVMPGGVEVTNSMAVTRDLLKDYMDGIVRPTDGAGWAVKMILDNLPSMLKPLGGMLVALPAAPLTIIKSSAKAIALAVKNHGFQDLEDSVHAGSPQYIISNLRDQINKQVLDHLSTAVDAAVAMALSPTVIGTVIYGALKAIYKLVTKILSYFRERATVRSIFDEAKKESALGTQYDAEKFNAWFKTVVSRSPIIASHLISMPNTGHYAGFLTVLYRDGTSISNSDLERHYYDLIEIQSMAKKWVSESTIRFKAPEGESALVLALDAAYKRNNINPGLLDQAQFYLKWKLRKTPVRPVVEIEMVSLDRHSFGVR